jgi:hypothetical protein
MFKLSEWTKRAGFAVLTTFAVIIASVFTPAPALAATSPTLGAAESYSVLAGSIVTNTGLTTMDGKLGISPSIGVPPHYTGFPPGIVGPPGTIHDADLDAGAAQAASTAAFLALSAGANAACTTDYGAIVQDLAGLSLPPGVYCANSFRLSGTLTLDDTGAPDGVWIFRTASGGDLSTTPGIVARVQFLHGIGSPCNVWWKVVSSATIGSGTEFIGNILALTSISLGTGATLNGRALAQTGAVTLDTNTITLPVCAGTNPTPTRQPPRGAVGGEIQPIDKASVLAPLIGLGLVLIIVLGGGILALTRRKAR